MKQTIVIDGWRVQLRVRVQRKKRKVKGRTRGRYEGKTAHVTVTAPDGNKRTWYVGSGDHLVRQVLDFGNRGEEKRRGAPPATSPSPGAGGRKGGKNARVIAIDTRDASDTRTLSMFPEGELGQRANEWFRKRKR